MSSTEPSENENLRFSFHSVKSRPVRRGGSRGFGRTPFFGRVYRNTVLHYEIDSRSTTGLVQRTVGRVVTAGVYIILHAQRKASGAARLLYGGSGPGDGGIFID